MLDYLLLVRKQHRVSDPCHEVHFEDEVAEAALMVDASNAFNSLSEVALRNTHILCPSLAPVLTNTYRSHSRLFIAGGHILSQEGTTQGESLALAMYAIGILPLINKISGEETQSWYADDASASGKVSDLRKVWMDTSETCLTLPLQTPVQCESCRQLPLGFSTAFFTIAQ